MATTTYTVTGMSCEHCVRAVTTELAGLDGVSTVSVELAPGGVSRVTVTSDAPLPAEAVSGALDEAGGYRIDGDLYRGTDGAATPPRRAQRVSRR